MAESILKVHLVHLKSIKLQLTTLLCTPQCQNLPELKLTSNLQEHFVTHVGDKASLDNKCRTFMAAYNQLLMLLKFGQRLARAVLKGQMIIKAKLVEIGWIKPQSFSDALIAWRSVGGQTTAPDYQPIASHMPNEFCIKKAVNMGLMIKDFQMKDQALFTVRLTELLFC